MKIKRRGSSRSRMRRKMQRRRRRWRRRSSKGAGYLLSYQCQLKQNGIPYIKCTSSLLSPSHTTVKNGFTSDLSQYHKNITDANASISQSH